MMKTSKKQFERFKKSFNKWVIKFGLLDYHIEFFHRHLDERAYARINACPGSCVASVEYNKEIPDCSSFESPEVTAKHEAIHLLIARLSILTSDEVLAQVTVENERITRVLEKLLR